MRKEVVQMPMPSIFRKRDEAQAPEVEVQGDEVVIKSDDDKPDRKAKLPGTVFA